MPVRVSNALTATRPSSSAPSRARSVPILQKGVRIPSITTSRWLLIYYYNKANSRFDLRFFYFWFGRPIFRPLLYLRPIIDNLLLFKLLAHALQVPQLLRIMKNDPIRPNFRAFHKPVVQLARNPRLVNIARFLHVQDQFIQIQRIVVALANLQLPRPDI